MITEAQLNAVAADINAAYLNDELITQLRQQHAPIHFTYCMDDDICGFNPIVSNDKFNLYLINGSEHCLSLSHNLQTATGLVVAEIIED